jgi:hypothetical protein
MYGNPEVVSLTGLQNLESVSDLEISDGCTPVNGAKLANLHGLEQLAAVDFLKISGQGGLLSLDGLPTEISLGFAVIANNPMLDQALIDEWFAAAMLRDYDSCDNLNGLPCEGICPQ